jgi:hypothetical protein
MAISSAVTVVPFSGWGVIESFLEISSYKIVICLKCQNLKKLQRMEKYKNWSN